MPPVEGRKRFEARDPASRGMRGVPAGMRGHPAQRIEPRAPRAAGHNPHTPVRSRIPMGDITCALVFFGCLVGSMASAIFGGPADKQRGRGRVHPQ